MNFIAIDISFKVLVLSSPAIPTIFFYISIAFPLKMKFASGYHANKLLIFLSSPSSALALLLPAFFLAGALLLFRLLNINLDKLYKNTNDFLFFNYNYLLLFKLYLYSF